MAVKNMHIVTQKCSLTNNNIKPGQFKLVPQLRRTISRINDMAYFVDLQLTILNSKENPFPSDVEVILRGIFEFDSNDSYNNEFMKYEAVDILYPYLRSMVSSLAAIAMFPPIVLPIVNARALFKEDQIAYIS